MSNVFKDKYKDYTGIIIALGEKEDMFDTSMNILSEHIDSNVSIRLWSAAHEIEETDTKDRDICCLQTSATDNKDDEDRSVLVACLDNLDGDIGEVAVKNIVGGMPFLLLSKQKFAVKAGEDLVRLFAKNKVDPTIINRKRVLLKEV